MKYMRKSTPPDAEQTDPKDESPQIVPKDWVFKDTKDDFQISFRLYKENFKAYFGSEIFAFGGLIVVGILIGIVTIVNQKIVLSTDLSFIADLLVGLFTIVALIIGLIIFQGFLGCQYGLAYDIMSSGDMFAEFKGSFSYFKKYWWQYPIISFVSGFFTIIIPPFSIIVLSMPEIDFEMRFIEFTPLFLLKILVLFVIFTIFAETYASLTAQGNLRKAFVESVQLVLRYPKRLFTTWAIYYAIFIVPTLIMVFMGVFAWEQSMGWEIIFPIAMTAFAMGLSIIWVGFPMTSLLSTRIYNSLMGPKNQVLENIDDQKKNIESEKINNENTQLKKASNSI